MLGFGNVIEPVFAVPSKGLEYVKSYSNINKRENIRKNIWRLI